jgi:adenine-specific DNA methylase
MEMVCRSVLLKMRNFSDKNRREYKNTFYLQELLSKYRAIYEIMWKNVAKPSCGLYTILLLNQTLGSARQNCSITVILRES